MTLIFDEKVVICSLSFYSEKEYSSLTVMKNCTAFPNREQNRFEMQLFPNRSSGVFCTDEISRREGKVRSLQNLQILSELRIVPCQELERHLLEFSTFEMNLSK